MAKDMEEVMVKIGMDNQNWKSHKNMEMISTKVMEK